MTRDSQPDLDRGKRMFWIRVPMVDLHSGQMFHLDDLRHVQHHRDHPGYRFLVASTNSRN